MNSLVEELTQRKESLQIRDFENLINTLQSVSPDLEPTIVAHVEFLCRVSLRKLEVPRLNSRIHGRYPRGSQILPVERSALPMRTAKDLAQIWYSLGYVTSPEITQLSRVDFVDRYVGWSTKKTMKILEENLGKVVVIDEIDPLVMNVDDKFGIEALMAINLFLSQHPNQITIIFTGSTDLIFECQPGLAKRLEWCFK